nr:NAD(P)H-dependent oxidoreductase [uncultured Sphingorhabdus sp.]
MHRLLIIWDSMTGGSEALARASYAGACRTKEVDVRIMHASRVHPADVLAADAYMFIFPENLAAISGTMKSFFDRCYYPCLGQLNARAYIVIVCAGSDGRNAVAQAERIAVGWRLRKIAESMIVCTYAQTPEAICAPKTIDDASIETAATLGEQIASGLSMGIY